MFDAYCLLGMTMAEVRQVFFMMWLCYYIRVKEKWIELKNKIEKT